MSRLIIEADGGSRGNPGPAAIGYVIYTPEGEVLAEYGEKIGISTNNVAEYSALVAALRSAKEIDPDADIVVRMDSQLVVKQMKHEYKIKNPTLKKLAEIAANIFEEDQVTYHWIPREENKYADSLVNEALDK